MVGIFASLQSRIGIAGIVYIRAIVCAFACMRMEYTYHDSFKGLNNTHIYSYNIFTFLSVLLLPQCEIFNNKMDRYITKTKKGTKLNSVDYINKHILKIKF